MTFAEEEEAKKRARLAKARIQAYLPDNKLKASPGQEKADGGSPNSAASGINPDQNGEGASPNEKNGSPKHKEKPVEKEALVEIASEIKPFGKFEEIKEIVPIESSTKKRRIGSKFD